MGKTKLFRTHIYSVFPCYDVLTHTLQYHRVIAQLFVNSVVHCCTNHSSLGKINQSLFFFCIQSKVLKLTQLQCSEPTQNDRIKPQSSKINNQTWIGTIGSQVLKIYIKKYSQLVVSTVSDEPKKVHLLRETGGIWAMHQVAAFGQCIRQLKIIKNGTANYVITQRVARF